MLLQVDPDVLLQACGPDPSFICQEVLDRTGNPRTAELADVIFAKPLTILLILVIAWVVHRLVHRTIGHFTDSLSGEQPPSRRLKRRLRRTQLGQRLPESVLATGAYSVRRAARAATLGAVLRSLAGFAIWAVAGITILGELAINLGPLIASAGIAGLAIGFGAQSLVKDFLAGMFILIEDQYGVGDVVDAGEATGTVEALSLRTTQLRDVNGTMWHIPNGQIARVGNMSQQWARALLDVTVAYGADIDVAQATIKRMADEVWRDPIWAGRVLEEPELWGIEDLGPTGITIRLVLKTRPAAQWNVLRELRSRIVAGLAEEGIDVPQPNRVLLVDADVEGAGAPPVRKTTAADEASTQETGAAEGPSADEGSTTGGSGTEEAAPPAP